MRLNGTTAVVTGASSGLGRAMADGFVTEGASVVYSSRTEERLAAAVEAATGGDPAGEATAVPADVQSWDDVRDLVETARERYGPIDVLVNNAGVNQPKVNPDHSRRPVQDVPVSTWDTILGTNLRGAFLCAKAVLPGMLERDAGRLVHVSSGHGTAGRADRAPYVASKFGLEGLHESLALELDGSGVDSVALRPPDGGVYNRERRAVRPEPGRVRAREPGRRRRDRGPPRRRRRGERRAVQGDPRRRGLRRVRAKRAVSGRRMPCGEPSRARDLRVTPASAARRSNDRPSPRMEILLSRH